MCVSEYSWNISFPAIRCSRPAHRTGRCEQPPALRCGCPPTAAESKGPIATTYQRGTRVLTWLSGPPPPLELVRREGVFLKDLFEGACGREGDTYMRTRSPD